MKKQFLNLGKALNKAELRSISGGIKKDSAFCEDGESSTYENPCIPRVG